mmetsp:Transcript_87265/g.267088  ORF Transcript_87265/g.267088 Transcript_87265/m.267088 type:complete len:264 (+) Transcript_87265:755-1546(+)
MLPTLEDQALERPARFFGEHRAVLGQPLPLLVHQALDLLLERLDPGVLLALPIADLFLHLGKLLPLHEGHLDHASRFTCDGADQRVLHRSPGALLAFGRSHVVAPRLDHRGKDALPVAEDELHRGALRSLLRPLLEHGLGAQQTIHVGVVLRLRLRHEGLHLRVGIRLLLLQLPVLLLGACERLPIQEGEALAGLRVALQGASQGHVHRLDLAPLGLRLEGGLCPAHEDALHQAFLVAHLPLFEDIVDNGLGLHLLFLLHVLI